MVETVLGMTDLQIKLATAAGQLGLALMVFYVAWRQWRTARNKLKADLFEKRFRVVSQLHRALAKVEGGYVADVTGIHDLQDLVRESGFFFNRRIAQASAQLVNAIQKVAGVRVAADLLSQEADEWGKQADFITGPRDGWGTVLSAEQERELALLQQRVLLKNREVAELRKELPAAIVEMNAQLRRFDALVSRFLTLKH